jgi:hypothetical protein
LLALFDKLTCLGDTTQWKSQVGDAPEALAALTLVM